jgi:lysophospholipase L1-like esterase
MLLHRFSALPNERSSFRQRLFEALNICLQRCLLFRKAANGFLLRSVSKRIGTWSSTLLLVLFGTDDMKEIEKEKHRQTRKRFLKKLHPAAIMVILGLGLMAIWPYPVRAADQLAYGGTPWPVPGSIQSEDYDTGGEGVAYHDTTAGNSGSQYRTDDVDIWYSENPPEGYFTGAMATGEWLEYTINVADGGQYRFDFRVATPNSGRKLRAEIDGVDVTGEINLPNTGSWTVWQTVDATADLTAGPHVVRIFVIAGGLNLNWINISKVSVDASLNISDNFNDGNANGWTAVNNSGYAPKWQVKNGQYQETNFVGFLGTALQGGYHLGTYATLSSWAGAQNYRFSVTAKPFAASGQEIGTMFHFQNSNNYYRLSFSYSDGFSRLEKKVGGVFTTLAQNARSYPIGKTLTIVSEIDNGIIQISVNGEKLFSVRDTSLASGTIGLYCREGCAFDNVAVTAPGSAASITISDPANFSVFPTRTFGVRAVVSNTPTNATVAFTLDNNASACTAATQVSSGVFQAQCTGAAAGPHVLTAVLKNQGTTVGSDTHNFIATEGDYYISIGDSISWGMKDFYSKDGSTQDKSLVMLQGYQSNLADALNLSASAPDNNLIYKEAVPGDNSSLVLNSRMPAILERHPDANFAIVLLGTNDAGGTTPAASGEGCSGTACNGTFKGNLKAIINALNSAGKMPIVALVPPRFGDTGTAAPYANPASNPVNSQVISAYNRIIKGQDANPLTGYILGPDTYNYFLGAGKNRYTLFYDNLHPGALGLAVFAAQLRNSITSQTALPFVLDDICVKPSAGAACSAPTVYKQDLMESGDVLYIDQASFKLAGSQPAALNGGRWIRTANADRNKANSDYLSFYIGKSSQVYVAYDAGASSIPAWLQASKGFVNTGLQIRTTNTAAPALRLYKKSFPKGTVGLGGANAAGTGADANYVVIVK